MRAAVVEEVGSPPRPGERPEPRREPGEALVEVRAAALNPIEVRTAAGRGQRRPQPPYVPGTEGAGVVLEAERMAPGTRVRFEGDLPGFGSDGLIAERATVAEAALVQLPDEVDDGLAAALGVVGVTARGSLERARLRDGDRVLVLGATGGVGQVGVQLARLMGAARVVAAGRDRERLERARELGAHEVVALDDEDDLAQAFQDAAGGPLDVVLDPLWGEPGVAALRALGEGGRLVNVGESAGSDVTVPLAAIRSRQVALLTLSSGWMPLPEKLRLFRAVLDDAAEGRLTVDREELPLDAVAEAWERQAASPGRKLVIRPGAA